MLGHCLAYERSVTLKLAVQTESSREMHGQIWGLSHPPHTPRLLPSSLACIKRCMPAGGATDALQGRISLALGAVAYLYLTAWLLITVCSLHAFTAWQQAQATAARPCHHITFATGCYALDAACDAQPFIEEDQPILRAFPRREVASLFVAWLIVLLLCAAGAVVGMQLLLS